MRFNSFIPALAVIAALADGQSAKAQGAGDLLVAPTRVVLESGRGTEVILNNIGAQTATYRISLELRRMTKDGDFDEIEPAKANEIEAKALAMISYAPRRVVLMPNQPQSIRIGIRPPAGLPDGEYRAHMLFRAIPAARPATAPAQSNGLSVLIQPIYGITIPIIVRRGVLKATASLADAKLVMDEGEPALAVAIGRVGTRSTFGRIRVLKSGVSKPLYETSGIAVYPEVAQRTLTMKLTPELLAALKGSPVTIQYLEDVGAGSGVMAELKTVIR
jgi:P pilus assembly chaperone PapD